VRSAIRERIDRGSRAMLAAAITDPWEWADKVTAAPSEVSRCKRIPSSGTARAE
jgi:hypothetical protein